MAKRLWQIKKRINKKLVDEGQDEITLEKLVEHVRKNYSDVKIDDEHPHLASVSKEIGTEIVADYVGELEGPYRDLNEHIFLKFLNHGRYIIPVDLRDEMSEKEKNKLINTNIAIHTSPAGTTDLAHYISDMALDTYEIEDYAEYCKTHFSNVKELTWEQFKSAARGNQVALDNKEIPVDMTEGLSKEDAVNISGR